MPTSTAVTAPVLPVTDGNTIPRTAAELPIQIAQRPTGLAALREAVRRPAVDRVPSNKLPGKSPELLEIWATVARAAVALSIVAPGAAAASAAAAETSGAAIASETAIWEAVLRSVVAEASAADLAVS